MKVPMVTKTTSVLLLMLCFHAAAMTGGAVEFRVVNAIKDEESRRNFDKEIASEFARVLSDATKLAWATLGQATASDRKDFAYVTLVVAGGYNEGDYSFFTRNNTIYLRGCFFDKHGVIGILYREVTNIWQFDGNGQADKGLLVGIAELLQMRSGYPPVRWPKAGEGAFWNERTMGVTAQFLEYCDTRRPGLVAKMARKMKTGYNERFFAELTGKTVVQLWKEYKAASEN